MWCVPASTTRPPCGPLSTSCAAAGRLAKSNAVRMRLLRIIRLPLLRLVGGGRGRNAGARAWRGRHRLQAFERLAAELEEQDRREDRVERGRADEAAEDRDRDRMQDFLARTCGIDQQRSERHAGRERGHQHRGQAIERAADDELLAKRYALMDRKIDVTRNLEDAVACGN